MSDLVKVYVTIPEAARDIVVETSAILREDPAFLGRLKRFVDDDQKPAVSKVLAEILARLGKLENQIEALDADLQEIGTAEFSGPDPSWTTGSGIGKKLTDTGRTEMIRLFERGLTDKQIAKRMGYAISSIAQKRKMYDLERAARSEG